MRIVAGTLRGRAVSAPEGEGTRPTVDRVREALFSSLYSLRGGFEGAEVLDAFAGSGALGIESLSRGARHATFYEKNGKAFSVLKRNLESCGLAADAATPVKRDVLTAIPAGHAPAFDLVFLDPPYDYDAGEVLAMVCALHESGALAQNGIVVYEHALKSKDDVAAAAEAAGFSVHASKKYGKTGVTILIMEQERTAEAKRSAR